MDIKNFSNTFQTNSVFQFCKTLIQPFSKFSNFFGNIVSKLFEYLVQTLFKQILFLKNLSKVFKNQFVIGKVSNLKSLENVGNFDGPKYIATKLEGI